MAPAHILFGSIRRTFLGKTLTFTVQGLIIIQIVTVVSGEQVDGQQAVGQVSQESLLEDFSPQISVRRRSSLSAFINYKDLT